MADAADQLLDRYKTLRLSRRGSVLVVELDNPPTNAVTQAMHAELATIFTDINRDHASKVVVLTGAGERAFSAGGSVQDMQALLDDSARMIASIGEARETVYALLRLEKPIIARLNGHAIGLGATLALFCDLIYAVDTAKIGDPHVSVGFVAGDGGAFIWPQLIGYARAREFLLTGDPILAPEAAAIGLINRAVPLAELDAVSFGMAERLASGATFAISATKVAINLTLRRQFEAVIDAHAGYEFMSNFTADHREAVAAFLEKRKPHFTGR